VKAVVWHGKEDVRVDRVPDPRLQEPTDAVVRVTSTAICGSDLHLYSKLGLALKEGDILGHEAMGVVEEVGVEVQHIRPGDRVVVPFNISCGSCWLCERGLHSQCETTQNRRWKKGASLFGYTHLYGAVPGGQAEYLRVPMAHFGPIKVPDGPPDTIASCSSPTCCPRRGRRWSTQRCRRTASSASGGSARWARWRRASPCTAAQVA
jgi:threonine dehydrogenase-like Zn-dependent dehydrogenase